MNFASTRTSTPEADFFDEKGAPETDYNPQVPAAASAYR